MDFRQLQYIVTVADCHSITAAAKQLFISQPSLSFAISQIEKEEGVQLFDRNQHPIALTDAGRIYVKGARDILKKSQEIKSRIADLQNGKGGSISLGIPSERAGYMLPPIINKFREQYPDSAFTIKEAGSADLLDLLKNNKVDFIVCPVVDFKIPVDMVAERIYRESVQLIAAPDAFSPDMFLDMDKRIVDLKKVAAFPFIGVKPTHSIHYKVANIFQEYGIEPKLLMEVESSSTAAQLAACGLGFTIVPRRASKILGPDRARYCYQYSAQPIQWDITAIYKKGTYLNQAERYFITLLQQEFSTHE